MQTLFPNAEVNESFVNDNGFNCREGCFEFISWFTLNQMSKIKEWWGNKRLKQIFQME